MRIPSPAPPSSSNSSDAHPPVPAARPMSQFSSEWIGDDVVLFDAELNRYHTLNRFAYDVWHLCDGRRSIDDITAAGGGHRETIEATVEQLGESGLLEALEELFDSTVSRRRMMKFIAAGVLGGVAAPIVKSITVPDAASAFTGTCPDGKFCSGPDKCCCCNPDQQGVCTFTCSNTSACAGQSGKYCVAV